MRNIICMTLAALVLASWGSVLCAEGPAPNQGNLQVKLVRMERVRPFSTMVRDSCDVASMRQMANRLLATQLEAIERSTTLSPSQREKLELAGKGDIDGFFKDAEPVIQHAMALEWDSPDAQQATRKIAEINRKLPNLHGLNSLFQKTRRSLNLQPSVYPLK
jgi:hypothetical protein